MSDSSKIVLAATIGIGAVATIVASEWPTLSASTYALLGSLAGSVATLFAPSPLAKK